MLPHVRDRPLTMKRYPDGVEGQSFFEKNRPSHAPDWVRHTVGAFDWLRAARSTTPWSATSPPCCGRPTWPPSSSTFRCGTSATDDVCRRLPITWCSTSIPATGRPSSIAAGSPTWSMRSSAPRASPPGRRPADRRASRSTPRRREPARRWESIRKLAHEIARRLEDGAAPTWWCPTCAGGSRAGKVLIDWSQNHPAKTTVAVYSVRARPHADRVDPGDLGRSRRTACDQASPNGSGSPPTEVLGPGGRARRPVRRPGEAPSRPPLSSENVLSATPPWHDDRVVISLDARLGDCQELGYRMHSCCCSSPRLASPAHRPVRSPQLSVALTFDGSSLRAVAQPADSTPIRWWRCGPRSTSAGPSRSTRSSSTSTSSRSWTSRTGCAVGHACPGRGRWCVVSASTG